MVDQSLDFLPVMGIAFIPAVITWGLTLFLSLSNIVLLSVQIILYPGLVVILSVLFRLPAFYELIQILKDKITLTNFVNTIGKTK